MCLSHIIPHHTRDAETSVLTAAAMQLHVTVTSGYEAMHSSMKTKIKRTKLQSMVEAERAVMQLHTIVVTFAI